MSEVVKTLTLSELLNVLSSEMHRLREGNTTPANVNALCNLSGKYMAVVKLNLEMSKMMGQKPNVGMLTEGDQPISEQTAEGAKTKPN